MREQKINRREILKMLVTLSIPTILEEILSTLLQYVDKIGRASCRERVYVLV